MRDAWEGVRDGLLFFPLYLPTAMSFAVAAHAIGIADWQIVLWSALVFAASSQLAGASALAGGAGVGDIVVITFMANARHAFIALAIAPYYSSAGRRMLAWLAFTATAPPVALLPLKAARGGDLRVYGAATHTSQWLQWISFTWLGVLIGPLLPASWGAVIAFAAPAAFVGLLNPLVRENLRVNIAVSAISAGLALALTAFWSSHASAIIAALCAAAAGLLLPERTRAA